MRFIFILFFLLPSCSNTGIYGELGLAIRDLVSQPKDISSERVNEIPYDVMQARIGRTPFSLVVLEEVLGNELKWTSSNFVKIYTKNGIIVRLSGLENELNFLEIDDSHPLINKSKDNQKTGDVFLTHFYNFKNPDLFNLPVKTKFEYVKEESVVILEKKFKTFLYKESSMENLINWQFENFYWVDIEEGKIIKSVQSVSPKISKIYLKLLEKKSSINED
jgi:hypothetical protein